MKIIFYASNFFKILLIASFIIFALILIFYGLLGWSVISQGKIGNVFNIVLIFMQHFILPIIFYILGAIFLIFSKKWAWNFIITGGIIIVFLNLPNIALRFIHLSIYLLALLTYFLKG